MTGDDDGEADPPLVVDNVALALGEVPVLEGVSMTVEEGRFVGLIGPNGAGKTTLLRVARGLVPPDEGTVTIAGEDVTTLSARERARRVASVPQETSVAFEFTVREVVEMGRTPHVPRFGTPGEADRDAVEAAMEGTEVADFADRPVTEVSGGERSRVLLARALAQDTGLLLLDEPTASLDVNHQVRTLELVRSLVAEGRTVVAAIHDLNLAARYCDELVLLADGTVLAEGPPATVLTSDRLREAFAANAVVAADPVVDAPRVTPLPGTGDGGHRVHVVGGGGRAGPLVSRLVAEGHEVSVGAVPTGDGDARVAAAHDLPCVTVPPFATPGERARDAVAEHVEAADAVVVADVELVAGQRANLAAARDADRLICVETRPLAERAADPQAVETYRDLRAAGIAVDGEGVLAAIDDGPATRPEATSPPTDQD